MGTGVLPPPHPKDHRVKEISAADARGLGHGNLRKAFTAEDIRFTRKGSALYAIALAWPDSGVLTIRSLAQGSQLLPSEVATVELLGSAAPVSVTRDDKGLHVKLPPAPAVRPHAVTLRIRTRS